MRDPKRIDRITNLVRDAWKLVPDFRFWQFICYLVEYIPEDWTGKDLFFAEEDMWETALENMLGSAVIDTKEEKNDTGN